MILHLTTRPVKVKEISSAGTVQKSAARWSGGGGSEHNCETAYRKRVQYTLSAQIVENPPEA
jgi:hypothetical protein